MKFFKTCCFLLLVVNSVRAKGIDSLYLRIGLSTGSPIGLENTTLNSNSLGLHAGVDYCVLSDLVGFSALMNYYRAPYLRTYRPNLGSTPWRPAYYGGTIQNFNLMVGAFFQPPAEKFRYRLGFYLGTNNYIIAIEDMLNTNTLAHSPLSKNEALGPSYLVENMLLFKVRPELEITLGVNLSFSEYRLYDDIDESLYEDLDFNLFSISVGTRILLDH